MAVYVWSTKDEVNLLPTSMLNWLLKYSSSSFQIVLAESKDLTNIETAPPGLLASTAETDRGEGDVGHIGHLKLGQVRPSLVRSG